MGVPSRAAHPWSWVTSHLPYHLAAPESGMRVFLSTWLEMVVFHAVVVLGVGVLTRRTHDVAWYTPSVALLLSSISTVLLLSLGLVWDSSIPTDQLGGPRPWEDPAPSFLAVALTTLAAPVREGNTEWMIRHVLGGMSAGVALRGR